jgi:hypothetical protein
MARSKTVSVTPNMKKCLKIMKEAAEALPAGDLKRRSLAAVDYMSRTFEGERQPHKGGLCPDFTVIIPGP